MTNRFLLLGMKGPSSQKAKKLPRHSAISLLPVIRCKRARARNSFSRLGSHRECPNQDSLRDRYQIYVLSKFQIFPSQFKFLAIFQSSDSEAVWSARARQIQISRIRYQVEFWNENQLKEGKWNFQLEQIRNYALKKKSIFSQILQRCDAVEIA